MSFQVIRQGRIASIERLPSSASGNPRYALYLTDGTALKTAPDAAINYGITNPEYRDRDVTFTIERGRVVYAEPAGD